MDPHSSNIKDPALAELEAGRISLDENPVFHLSLNSKELFHSNLLAWMFEHHAAIGRRVLELLGVGAGDDTVDVRREHRQLDLSIKLAGLGRVVIENKVFDLPKDEQLERYAEGLTGHGADMILLSLTDPDWPEGTLQTPHGSWRYISYATIADALEASLDEDESAGFDTQLLSRYCGMIRDLCRVAELTSLGSPHEPIGLSSETQEELGGLRLAGAMGKRRARQALALIEGSHAIPAVKPTWKADFTRGRPLIEAFFECDGDEVGWQYQDDQWRVAVKTARHHGGAQRAEREQYVRERYPNVFNFDAIAPFAPQLVVPAKEAAGGYYGFKPNFVYCFRPVPPLSAEQISHASNHCLDHLARSVRE